MWAAPLGAFGGMAYTVAQFGSASLANLGLLMVAFWGTCAIFVFGVLGLVARISGFNILRLIRMIRDELLIIVGTSSSETVLPRLLAKLEAAGASRQTVGLVIPTGYSFNLDGTCIYLTMGALFIVQAAGQDIPIATQIGLLALMVLTSKGAAGITGAGLVTLVASLQAFGGEFFSPEAIAVGIALVVGIDRVMSEGRALTNAIGNSVATMVIAGWTGERNEERFQAALRDPSTVEELTERALRGEEVSDMVGRAPHRPLRARAGARRRRLSSASFSSEVPLHSLNAGERPSGAAGDGRRCLTGGRLPYAKGSHHGWPGRGVERGIRAPVGCRGRTEVQGPGVLQDRGLPARLDRDGNRSGQATGHGEQLRRRRDRGRDRVQGREPAQATTR